MSKALNISLWIAQALLAVAFLFAGGMKLILSSETLAKNPGPSVALVRFIGVAEVAGALGMILPMVTRIRPRLTALAAVGLATVMLLAIGFHVMRGELSHIPAPAVLGALAVFVAWGRRRAGEKT
ncbi:MAG TPA: DoxX family protein [Polyangia bacterium]|nr:DoxX family protein [Polyangia bacterium]